VIIETPRLILRPFQESDAGDLLEYLAEPAVSCFASMKLNSVDEAKEASRERARNPEYYFAITLKDSGKVIGEIFTCPEDNEAGTGSAEHPDTFSPCWMLNTAYQKQNYAFEAARAFIDYLFRKKGARRIYAYTEDSNLPGQHLCERLGMRKEGLFVEFVSFIRNPDGTPRYENTYQYAVLRKEWHCSPESSYTDV